MADNKNFNHNDHDKRYLLYVLASIVSSELPAESMHTRLTLHTANAL